MSRLAPEGAALTSVAESEFPLASRRRRRLTRQRIGHAAAPYALLAPAAVAIGVILGLPAVPAREDVVREVRPLRADPAQGPLGRHGELRADLPRPEFWHVLLRTVALHRRERHADDGARDGDRLAAPSGVALAARRAHDRARPRVVGAGDRRSGHLALDGRLRVRRPELDADEASHRELHPARLVRESVDRLRRDHGADRLGRDSVRHDHGLRSARPGAAGTARGGGDRRRPSWRCSAR